MGDAEITASSWKLVEVGRVILLSAGPYSGRLAVIVEIIDHKRVLIHGPSSNTDKIVPRHAVPLSEMSLTSLIIPKLPRGAGNGPVARAWEKAEIDSKWTEGAWAKNKERMAKRRQLTDFERFKVMRLRKQARFEVRKETAKIRKSAKAS